MKSASDVDVLVVGGGPAGLATAHGLAQNGYSVHVTARRERSPGSGLTLWPNAVKALESLGLDGILSNATPLEGMQMSDAKGRPITIIDEKTFARRFGRPGYALTRGAMIAALHRATSNIDINPDDPLEAIESCGTNYACHTRSRSLSANFIVGADGFDSIVRRHLHPHDSPRDLSMRVIRGLASLDIRPHRAEVLMGAGLQFGMFAMSEITYWFVSFARERAHRTVRASLESTLSEFPPMASQLARATADEALCETDVFDRDPITGAWGSGGITLVGDAAHLAAPTLGQGACQAFEDAAVLSALTRQGLSAGVFRAYECARSRRTSQMVSSARTAARAGIIESPTVARIRNTMMRAIPTAVMSRRIAMQFDFAPPAYHNS